MSFLAPLYLLGALAVALPVVFHLVRRSSREHLVFSSLMFLRQMPPRMTKRNRLEHWFLLLLRCLAICALSVGFARPFFQKAMPLAMASDPGVRLVLLVDASASMQREGVWAEALARADKALKDAGPADEVAVMTFDREVRTLVGFEDWVRLDALNRAALTSKRLAEVKPSWRSTQSGQALIAAAALLEEETLRRPHGGARRIVLISDLQEGSHLDAVQGHEWPPGLEVAVEVVKAGRPTNAGLAWLAEGDERERVAAEAGVRIRVSNNAESKREQFQVRWEGFPGAALDAYVPPGQSRVMAAPKLPAAGNGGRLVLSGDDDAFDNGVFVETPKAEETRVLFLGTDAEQDPAQLLYYLKRAFPPTRRQAVRVRRSEIGDGRSQIADRRSESGERRSESADGRAEGGERRAEMGDSRSQIGVGRSEAGELATNRLVVVGGVVTEAQAVALRGYAERGGTVLWVMTDAASAGRLGQVVGVPDLRASEAAVTRYALLGRIDFAHPLFAPFAEARFSDFSKIRFWRHRTLAVDQLPGAHVVARFDRDDPAILDVPVGTRGRVLVFTFSWRPADSQFALSSKFVPMLGSILDQAGGGRAVPGQFRVGDAVDLALLTGGPGGWTVRKPDGVEGTTAAGASFTQTDLPGVYEVRGGPQPVRFVVNLDPAESRTTQLPLDELMRLGLPTVGAVKSPVSAAASPVQHQAELEGRQKTWRWLLAAALAVLLVETWLAGRTTRRSPVPMEAGS